MTRPFFAGGSLFFPQIAIAIIGVLIGVLTSNRGWGRRTTLADWTWHQGAISGCSGRGAIAGCHCSVLWWGKGRVTTNFGGVVVPLQGAVVVCFFSLYIDDPKIVFLLSGVYAGIIFFRQGEVQNPVQNALNTLFTSKHTECTRVSLKKDCNPSTLTETDEIFFLEIVRHSYKHRFGWTIVWLVHLPTSSCPTHFGAPKTTAPTSESHALHLQGDGILVMKLTKTHTLKHTRYRYDMRCFKDIATTGTGSVDPEKPCSWLTNIFAQEEFIGTTYGFDLQVFFAHISRQGMKTVEVWHFSKNHRSYLQEKCVKILRNLHFLVSLDVILGIHERNHYKQTYALHRLGGCGWKFVSSKVTLTNHHKVALSNPEKHVGETLKFVEGKGPWISGQPGSEDFLVGSWGFLVRFSG